MCCPQDINETASRVAAAQEAPLRASPAAISMLQRNVSSFSGIAASASPDTAGNTEAAAASRLKKGSGVTAVAVGSRRDDHNC
jgi:hypothetical protein